MFGIGTSELLIIVGLALIVLGPKKLPELARSIGKTMGELRKTTDELKETINEEIEPIKQDIPSKHALRQALEEQFMGKGAQEDEEEEGKDDEIEQEAPQVAEEANKEETDAEKDKEAGTE